MPVWFVNQSIIHDGGSGIGNNNLKINQTKMQITTMKGPIIKYISPVNTSLPCIPTQRAIHADMRMISK
jgi:hypothetical protein